MAVAVVEEEEAVVVTIGVVSASWAWSTAMAAEVAFFACRPRLGGGLPCCFLALLP